MVTVQLAQITGTNFEYLSSTIRFESTRRFELFIRLRYNEWYLKIQNYAINYKALIFSVTMVRIYGSTNTVTTGIPQVPGSFGK